MTTLSNRALLVSLNVSQWTARKFDKRETQELASRHGLVAEVARVNKTLLPFADKLESIHKYTGTIRTEYYKRTLPWSMEGVNILKADAYLEFTAHFAPMLSEWRSKVADFVQAYPDLKEDARVLLNGLYREEDYPDPADVARRFAIDLTFMPVPDADDWRVSLGDAEMEHLRQQIEERVTEAQGEAMQDAWRRIYDVVEKAHERLSQPDAIFRDTLVQNAVELCGILPSLNITDDPQLEAMRRKLEGTLCTKNPDTLRHDPLERSKVAKEMEALLSKMGAMYGAT